MTTMLREDVGRMLICCDRCAVRMDLGPVMAARARNRTPSGWLSTGVNRHACPSCSAVIGLPALAQMGRPPLVPAR
jgi:hypothetical protein